MQPGVFHTLLEQPPVDAPWTQQYAPTPHCAQLLVSGPLPLLPLPKSEKQTPEDVKLAAARGAGGGREGAREGGGAGGGE